MNKVIVIYTTSSASQSMYGNKAQYHWRFMSSSPTKKRELSHGNPFEHSRVAMAKKGKRNIFLKHT